MANKGEGRMFRRKDGMVLVYIPKDLTVDSMWPVVLERGTSVEVNISFEKKTIKIEESL